MGQAWYDECAVRFGGYRRLWDSRIEGENGEAAFQPGSACYSSR